MSLLERITPNTTTASSSSSLQPTSPRTQQSSPIVRIQETASSSPDYLVEEEIHLRDCDLHEITFDELGTNVNELESGTTAVNSAETTTGFESAGETQTTTTTTQPLIRKCQPPSSLKLDGTDSSSRSKLDFGTDFGAPADDDDEDDDENFVDFSVYENRTGLAEDMKFLASMPELCDITFLVGETREPVCAVKAVLAARSK